MKHLKMMKWRHSGMELKTIMAVVLVAFIVGAAIWLHIRRKNKK